MFRPLPDGCFRSARRICSSRSSPAHPSSHLAVFLSPVNLLLGAVVAALVGCNIAVAAHAARQAASCRRTRYARLLGVLPAFLLGFACCVPTFLLVLGASTAAALLAGPDPAAPGLLPAHHC